MTREELQQAVQTYFDRMDGGDVAGVVELFAPEGTLSCESTKMVLRGHDELRGFFESLTAGTNRMLHRPTNLVLDPEAGKASCELAYENDRKGKPRYVTENCNFFDLDEGGLFTRVRFWMGTLP